MITSFLIDNTIIYSFLGLLTYIYRTRKLEPLHGALIIWSIQAISILRDELYRIIFKAIISKEKLNLKVTMDLKMNILKIVLLFGAYFYVYVWFDQLHFEVKGWETYLLVTFEFWGMCILKDTLMMRTVHKWMHKPENFWIHKQHHKARTDVQVLNTFYFDVLDVFLENLIGPLLIQIFYFFVFGTTQLHFASFIWMLWGDITIHSLNPYSMCLANPILDYLMKINITHNLHHMVRNDYFGIYTWYHLYDPARKQKDIDLYNKINNTSFSFELFIDEKISLESKTKQ